MSDKSKTVITRKTRWTYEQKGYIVYCTKVEKNDYIVYWVKGSKKIGKKFQ